MTRQLLFVLIASTAACSSEASSVPGAPEVDATADGQQGDAAVEASDGDAKADGGACPARAPSGPCPTEGQSCAYGCSFCSCNSGAWYCASPGCAGGCPGMSAPPLEGVACGGCCGPSVGEVCPYLCPGGQPVTATCQASGWHLSHSCNAPPDGGLDARAEGGGGGACDAGSMCRTFSSYCGGCTCDALGASEPDPTCDGGTVNCFVDPCQGHVAACDPSGRCALR